MAARRKTGGRQKGVLNKATADVKAIARQYTDEAIANLAEIMRNGQSEQARVAAIREILDRGHGKATQVVAGDDDGGPVLTNLSISFVKPGAAKT